MKTCTYCLQDLPLSAFHKKLGGTQPRCKTCTSAVEKAQRALVIAARPPKPRPTIKRCNRCQQDLPLDAFHKKTGTQLQARCKKCRLLDKNPNGQQRPKTLEEAFWRCVTQGDPNECWEWAGHRFEKGYGRLEFQWEHFYAHRVAYHLFIEPIPLHNPQTINLLVCHTCDNPPCINPNHLFLGSILKNAQDAANKGRKAGIGGGVLTLEQVHLIRSLVQQGTPRSVVAKQFNVTYKAVSDIINGHTWKNL